MMIIIIIIILMMMIMIIIIVIIIIIMMMMMVMMITIIIMMIIIIIILIIILIIIITNKQKFISITLNYFLPYLYKAQSVDLLRGREQQNQELMQLDHGDTSFNHKNGQMKQKKRSNRHFKFENDRAKATAVFH